MEDIKWCVHALVLGSVWMAKFQQMVLPTMYEYQYTIVWGGEGITLKI